MAASSLAPIALLYIIYLTFFFPSFLCELGNIPFWTVHLLYKLSMQNLITPWLSYTHSQNYIPKCTSLSLLCIYIADSKWHLHGRERKCSTISLGGVVEAKEVAYQKLRFDWSLLLYLPLLYLKLRNVHAPLTFTSFVEGRIKFISKLEFSLNPNLSFVPRSTVIYLI